MVDDDGERLDWGNDDDEPQPMHDSYPGDVPEDAEDAISLGGDSEDERGYFINQSAEHLPPVSKSSSAMSHSHPSKRDSQRGPATVPSRAPSRAQDSASPTRDSKPPPSSGKPPLVPLMHALPPKPVLVPPLFEQPSEPGILASAMVNRPRKANGAGKGLVASDGGDPLPPDWEIRYPRNGGTDAYYYNIKTEESTWTRPRLPASGRASPTKMGGAQTSDHSAPEVQDDAWARRGRVQQFDGSRRNASSRRTSSPPNPDLSYADRHYRPGEGPAPVNAGDWRADRGATGPPYPAESYGRARSTTPQPVSGNRRRTRSTSPQWDRRARRGVSQTPPPDRWRESQREFSQDRQAGHADSAWSRSQEYPEPVLSGPRSPTDRRVRRKDDVEPPLHRRKDDVDTTTRRKDDIEPRIRRKDDIDLRRKDDTESHMRRKDDIEPRLRRKGDIEPPLRHKDDTEPPPRLPPSRDTSSRHPRDEWQAPRPPPPSSHPRESSPPRRTVPASLGPANTSYIGPGSNSAREPSRFERSDAPPPGRYRDNNPVDTLPQRRGRDVDMLESDFDHSKRRRLNDDQGTPRRPGLDFPASVPSLPAKPVTAPYSPHTSQVDQSQRRRAPLPPQDEHWRNRQSQPSPADFANLKLPIRIPSPERESPSNWVFTLPDGRKFNYCPTNQMKPPGFMGPGVMPLYDTPSGYISHKSGWTYPEGTGPIPPTRPGARNGRVDATGPPNTSSRGVREPDAMDIDPSPSFGRPPVPRTESAPRRGMYSDLMTATASEGLPRAPRAMVPRDGNGNAYPSSLPSAAHSPSSPYDNRPAGFPTNDYARGRGRPVPPVMDRRWEPNDAGRRPGQLAPSPVEPPQQVTPRDLPERPSGRVHDVEPRAGRGRPGVTNPTRRPTMSGTNNASIGGRYDNSTSLGTSAPPPPPPFQSNNNGYDSRRQYGGERGVEPSESYGSRSTQFPSSSEVSTLDRQRNDRTGRRLSVTTSDSMRGRGAPEPIDDRISPSTSRQSRFGPPAANTPNASAESEDRVWLTREQTQAARGPMMRGDDDRGPRDFRDADLSRRIDLPVRRDDLPPRRDDLRRDEPPMRQPSPPRGNFKPRWGSNQVDDSHGRLSSSASAPNMDYPRRDRPRTPPLPGDRRQEELPPVKVHPDRVRLLSAPTPGSLDASERGGRPVRDNRRGPDRPREYAGDRGRDLVRDLPPKPEEGRMGPPRDRSPPSQNGYRPGLKRGGSLLDRLTLPDSPPHEPVSSLRDRVDLVPQGSIESLGSLRSESMMDMDNDDSIGDDGSRGSGGGRGMGKRRNIKPRRGRRNGAP